MMHMAVQPHCMRQPQPIFEDHVVLVANNAMRYMQISRRNPQNPAENYLMRFKPVPRMVQFQPRLVGRLDGKDCGGRIGRCRGLGVDPVVWRADGNALPSLSTEYTTKFTRPTLAKSRLGVGMRTEIWSTTENCVYGTGLMLSRAA